MDRARILLALLTTLAGCAHYPVNRQSLTGSRAETYDFDTLEHPEDSDRLFFCLTFSGGGTRAAALAYGVMEDLRHVDLGNGRSLLDELDCISSVSGGSFTAAYYGLFRDRLFQDFRSRFLDRDIQGALLHQVWLPWNWWRLASPYYGRIDIAAELYRDEIFDGKTFADLKRQGRPFVILNATNLETGGRFDFTSLYFAAMGSEVADYPIGRAVAASSAFPFLLSPISLLNYPTAGDYQPPGWYAGAQTALHAERRRFRAAEELSYYLDKEHRYIHLMDGGLADNVGARAVLDAYSRGFINTRINNRQIDKLVVIVVNARTQPREDFSHHEHPPGLTTVAFKTATVSMDNYSFDTVALLIESLKQRVQAQQDVDGCQRALSASCPGAPALPPFPNKIDPYVIEITFDGAALVGEDPQYYLNLPTSFRLQADQVEHLVRIGPKLLHASPQYQCLLAVLKAEASGQPRPEACPVGAGLTGL